MRNYEVLYQMYHLIDQMSRRKAYQALRRQTYEKFSVWVVLKVFLAIVWTGWSRHLFYQKVRLDKRLRKILKLPNRMPSESQLGKRLRQKDFAQALVGLLSESAAEVLGRLGPQEVRILMMDLTSVPSHKKDRHAKLGYDGHEWFWGYKLGIVTSASGVVVGAALITANLRERRVTARLVRMAQRTVRTSFGFVDVKYLLCDAGFAGEKTYRQAHRYLKCRVVCPPQSKPDPNRKGPSTMEKQMRRKSPHRYRDWRFWKTPTAKKIYEQRGEIDRRLSQLTDEPFAIDRRPRNTVGIGPLLRWEVGELIFWNLALNNNMVHGRQIRKVKAYIA